MAKEKKALTPEQEERRYKALAKLCNAGQFASLIAPFVTIGLVNFGEYFETYDGWKISIAGIMAAFIMGVVVFTVVNKKIQNSYGPLIIRVAILTAILFLIDKIVYDLKFILLFTLFGLFGALALEKTSESLTKKAEKKRKGIEAAEEEVDKNAHLEVIHEREEKRKIRIVKRK